MSKTTEAVISRIRSRSTAGLAKYGTTMDRSDLSPAEWAAHAQEELLDGAQYLERLRHAADLLERARMMAVWAKGNAPEPTASSASEWLEEYDEAFS